MILKMTQIEASKRPEVSDILLLLTKDDQQVSRYTAFPLINSDTLKSTPPINGQIFLHINRF